MHFVKECPIGVGIQQRLWVCATPLQLSLDIRKLFQPFNFHGDIHRSRSLIFECLRSRNVSLFLVNARFANLWGIRIYIVFQKGHLVVPFGVSTRSRLLRARPGVHVFVSISHIDKLPISIHVVKVPVSTGLLVFFSLPIESMIDIWVVNTSHFVLVIFSKLFLKL